MKAWLVFAAFALALGGCSDSVRNTSRTFKTVVIDPGHGGHDNGATSSYAGREKDLALDVALRLRPKLQAEGFNTVMTRSDDTFIPLDTRAQISNRQSNALFVSIHFNDAPRSAPEGSEVYYRSRISASTAQNILTQIAAIPGNSSRGIKTANFRVLKRATFPAVLVECGFVSNPSEGRRCARPAHREALAEAIARGLYLQRFGRLPSTPVPSVATQNPPATAATASVSTASPTAAANPAASEPSEKPATSAKHPAKSPRKATVAKPKRNTKR